MVTIFFVQKQSKIMEMKHLYIKLTRQAYIRAGEK